MTLRSLTVFALASTLFGTVFCMESQSRKVQITESRRNETNRNQWNCICEELREFEKGKLKELMGRKQRLERKKKDYELCKKNMMETKKTKMKIQKEKIIKSIEKEKKIWRNDLYLIVGIGGPVFTYALYYFIQNLF